MPETDRSAWGEFLDDLVHELRAPLTAIGGYAALLADDALPPDARDAAATIEAQSGRLAAQLDLLLDIARLWSGRPPLTKERTNLAALAHTVAAQYGVPVDAPRNMWAEIDARLVRRAVTELITNATEHGAPPVGLVLSRMEHAVCLHVEDSGAGLAERHLAIAGRRPFMAGGDESRRNGRGLGLVFVTAVAEVHGGKLHYQRDEECTRFIIELPVDSPAS